MVALLHNLRYFFLYLIYEKKLMVTLSVFAVFRFGAHVPIPGVDVIALNQLFSSGSAGGFYHTLICFQAVH